MLLDGDGGLTRGEREDAPAHALANIGDSVALDVALPHSVWLSIDR